jgi:hypothetical protein
MDERQRRLQEILRKREARELNAAGKAFVNVHPERSLERFRAAVALVPDRAEYRHNLGVACTAAAEACTSEEQRKSLEDQAMVAFEEALRLKPDLFASVVNLTALLLKRRRWLDTVECVARAIAHGSVEGSVIDWFGSLPSSAALAAVASDPLASQCLSNVATALRVGGDGRLAVDTWRRWLEIEALGGADSVVESASSERTLFVCVKWGSKYDASYISALAHGLHSRGLPGAFEGEERSAALLCVTDEPLLDERLVHVADLATWELTSTATASSNASPHSTAASLEATEWKGWWQKARLFSPAANKLYATLARELWGLDLSQVCLVFLDVDVVVTGSLEPLLCSARAELASGAPLVSLSTRGFTSEGREDGVNSSVMVWRPADSRVGCIHRCLEERQTAAFALVQRFDHWLELLFDCRTHSPGAMSLLECPGSCGVVDFACFRDTEVDAQLVVFPLHPKPHRLELHSPNPRVQLLGRLFWRLAPAD